MKLVQALALTHSVALVFSGAHGQNLRQDASRDLVGEAPDVCGNTKCNKRSTCVNDKCVCKPGWTDPPFCKNLNECKELDPPPCNFVGAVCVDEDPHLDGSPGGMYHCACKTKEGWINDPIFDEHGPLSCGDLDECSQNPTPCNPNATCTNLKPGFNCTCKDGFEGDGQVSCVPVPSVPVVQPPEGQQCDKNCLKNPNSFCDEASRKCKCLEGFFSPSGLGGACKGRNYCKEGLDNCASKAKCIPLEGDANAGFFSCECDKGYITATGFRQGTVCVPHNECADGTNDCKSNELCIDLSPPDTFKCELITESPTPSPTTAPPTPAPTMPLRCGTGQRPCPDESCVATGSCCPNERLCAEQGACAASGTCCPNQIKCPDGTCVAVGDCCPHDTTCIITTVTEALLVASGEVRDPAIDPPIPAGLVDDILDVSPYGLVPGTATLDQPIYTVPEGGHFTSIQGSFAPASGFLVSDTKATLFGLDGLQGISLVDGNGRFRFILTTALPGMNPYFIVFSKIAPPARRDRRLAMNSKGVSVQTCLVSNNGFCPVANNPTGSISVTLTWNDGNSDIDLHTVEPDGTQVWYSSKQGSVGSLDVDNTVGYGPENYFSEDPAAGSSYTFSVRAFFLRTREPVPWTLRAFVGLVPVWEKSGVFTTTGQEAGPYVIELPSGGSRRSLADLPAMPCPPAPKKQDESSWCKIKRLFGNPCQPTDSYNYDALDNYQMIMTEYEKGGEAAAKMALAVFGYNALMYNNLNDNLEKISRPDNPCVKQALMKALCNSVGQKDFYKPRRKYELELLFADAAYRAYKLSTSNSGTVVWHAKKFYDDVVTAGSRAIGGLTIVHAIDPCSMFINNLKLCT